MAQDEWSTRAQAETQREEIQLLRGAVAALRATRARSAVSAHGVPAPSNLTIAIAAAFAVGVFLTAAGVALYRAALCP